MNRNEFIQKWEKKINHYQNLQSEEESICRKTKQSTSEYKNAYRRADGFSDIKRNLQRMLDDFRNIK